MDQHTNHLNGEDDGKKHDKDHADRLQLLVVIVHNHKGVVLLKNVDGVDR